MKYLTLFFCKLNRTVERTTQFSLDFGVFDKPYIFPVGIFLHALCCISAWVRMSIPQIQFQFSHAKSNTLFVYNHEMYVLILYAKGFKGICE